MYFLLIISLFLNITTKQSLAIESTSSADTKVEDFVTNILKPKVQSTTAPTPANDKPKSFFGSITKIDENTITISYKNQFQLIQVNDDTVYVDLKRNKSKLTNFKVGQEILAMGYLKEDESLEGKRIVATELKSVVNNNQTITGQIVDISKETSIFTLTPNYNKNSPFQIKTDSKTIVVNITNKTVSPSEEIVNGKKIIAIIKPDSKLEKTFYASKIIILDSPTPTSKP